MKKLFFTFLAVTALAFVGCEKKQETLDIMSLDVSTLDNTEFTCWKYTIENADVLNGTLYSWDTEANLVRVLQEVYKTSGNKAVISYERTPADDEEGCNSKNNF